MPSAVRCCAPMGAPALSGDDATQGEAAGVRDPEDPYLLALPAAV